MNELDIAYSNLNIMQKKAVDTIEGPVMVVAGPGTGKTQVLALRIARILQITDVGADAVLCLTFTRSGVSAMKNRLESYIGSSTRNVKISTFHSFAGDIVEKYHSVLDFDRAPTTLEDNQAVLMVDQLLHEYEWNYIRPRTNPAQYFADLKGLISILKRERLTPAMFLEEVDKEIESLKQDPESISTRGESKGQIKKEIEKKIESLERTKEVVEFYRLYENIKKEQGFMDYDDVLEYAVKIVELSEDARDDIRETYQYILIDEHQDSSGVQNAFLRAVWAGVDSPNIFVVGDDRQLIYGFSGASLSYFEEFKTLFGKIELITLTENYRSTANILSLADDLLQSSITKEKLKSNKTGLEKISLSGYSYERDEVISAGLFFKDQISKGVEPHECVLLVPKNRHVRNAISILRGMGLVVYSPLGFSLFDLPNAQSLIRILRIVDSPFDTTLLAQSLLDKNSNIPTMLAHTALHEMKNAPLTISTIENYGFKNQIFEGESPVSSWGKKLSSWINTLAHSRISEIVSVLGNEFLITNTKSHEELLTNTEMVRSLLHTSIAWEEKHAGQHLSEFIKYISRLEQYGQNIELASFGSNSGVQVMTLHRSKGLEYKNVWIAHINEETLMSQKRQAFTLPETIKIHIHERDTAAARRELYVAITRAKEVCHISFAEKTYDVKALTLANILTDLPQNHFVIKSSKETEEILLSFGPQIYTDIAKKETQDISEELKNYVKENYSTLKVSVTMLNNFFSCPWKWYFRNFLKLPENKSTSLALGSVVHTLIEFILKSNQKPDQKQLEDKIDFELNKEGIVDIKELKTLSKDAMSAVNNWIEIYYPNLSKERVSERSVSFRDPIFPHLSMYGKIDLTERYPNGDVSVTDFKTGKVKTTNEIEKETSNGQLSDYMRQLVMYSYLIKGAEKGTAVTSSRLLFVEADKKDKNSLYEARITDSQIELLIKDIKEYDENIKSGEWVSRACLHKGYGDNSDCEYCTLSKSFML
jgi:DNA helicase II / ATP-dependent DNA helicase PcrA